MISTHTKRASQGFTLVELLVVMGIIAIMAALTIGVATSLRSRSKRDATRMLIDKVETALDEYKTQVGSYPDAIPTASWLQAKLSENPPALGAIATQFHQTNRAVARILSDRDEFSTASGSHSADLIRVTVSGNEQWFLVDTYIQSDEGITPDVKNNMVQDYHLINIVRGGHNTPGLDIWSTGPNGVNDALKTYAQNANPQNYGDDITNWGGEGQ